MKIELSDYVKRMASVNLDKVQIPNVDGLTSGSSRKTFWLSYERISDQCPLAAEVLHMTALLHRMSIPRQLSALLLPDKDIDEAIGILDAFSVLEQRIKPGDENFFELHHTAQLQLRARLTTLGIGAELHRRAMDALLSILRDVDEEHAPPDFILQCLPHAQELLQRKTCGSSGEPTLKSQCILRIASAARGSVAPSSR